MKDNKNKSFIMFSKRENVHNILCNMQLNQKLYLRLVEALQILGRFDDKVEVDSYDRVESKMGTKIRLWCTDSEENLFIFYGISCDRKDWLKIIKETNEEELEYDISLAKKHSLNLENINFTRTKQIYDFKFGRLVTDEKTFYSLFLGNDIAFQILGSFNGNVIKDLLNQLNELKSESKFMDFLNIFNNILTNNKIQYFISSISAIKDFELTGSFQLNIEDKKKVYIKEKN